MRSFPSCCRVNFTSFKKCIVKKQRDQLLAAQQRKCRKCVQLGCSCYLLAVNRPGTIAGQVQFFLVFWWFAPLTTRVLIATALDANAALAGLAAVYVGEPALMRAPLFNVMFGLRASQREQRLWKAPTLRSKAHDDRLAIC
jgi:hypothetical protein